jgi:hypothetical protein
VRPVGLVVEGAVEVEHDALSSRDGVSLPIDVGAGPGGKRYEPGDGDGWPEDVEEFHRGDRRFETIAPFISPVGDDRQGSRRGNLDSAGAHITDQVSGPSVCAAACMEGGKMTKADTPEAVDDGGQIPVALRTAPVRRQTCPLAHRCSQHLDRFVEQVGRTVMGDPPSRRRLPIAVGYHSEIRGGFGAQDRNEQCFSLPVRAAVKAVNGALAEEQRADRAW